MTIRGVVRVWHRDGGWGVIDSPSTPGGCWAHFSTVATSGHRSLAAGQVVELEWETPVQDGYDFLARRVGPYGQEPHEGDPITGPSDAYRSSLMIHRDDEKPS